jgi:hypothetical protein
VQNMDTETLEKAVARADALWRDHGQRAMREQGCLVQPTG